MPYDRFLRLQIAGDLVKDSEPDPFVKLAGLGFQGLGAEYHRGSVTAQVIADELDDRIDTLTRGLLGLTVACARCHDHKYDPIPTRDYYSLAAAYNGSNLMSGRSPMRRKWSNFEDGSKKSRKRRHASRNSKRTAKARKAMGRAERIRRSQRELALCEDAPPPLPMAASSPAAARRSRL